MKDFRNIKVKGGTHNYKDYSGGDFTGAELCDMKFYQCDFRGVKFTGIKLERVYFIECLFDTIKIFSGTWLLPFVEEGVRAWYETKKMYDGYFCVTIRPKNIYFPVETDGTELIGYKKIYVPTLKRNTYIIAIAKLCIPAYADRIVYSGGKCRASCAQVLEIIGLDKKRYEGGVSAYYNNPQAIYRVGYMVYADSFDTDPFDICSHGIHFFLSRQEAEEY